MFSEETLYSVALRHCPLIGDIIFRKLVGEVGSAKEVWDLSKSGLKNIYGIGKKISLEIGNPDHLDFAEKELKFCEKNNIKINLRHQNDLPTLLNECEDAPAILYQKGIYDASLKPLSLVGTRNITSYGKHFIHDFLEEVKNKNIITVSGLALGVDTEAHQVSVANQIPTVAVLAHGFHTLYPSKNKKLSEKILEENGVLFSEFNSSQKPDRENFIQRNRVIAGLSPATIVVETAFGGGSISTATFALNYNREVFALPGRISDKYSQGCNQLIFQNKAAIISTISALGEQLGFHGDKEKTGELFPRSEIRIQLSEMQQNILNAIDKNKPISLDELSEQIEIATYKILPDLLQLEISGYIKALSGRQYLAI
ncbi:DNA-processing protein DprA [Kaistella jeonii]|uniref:DNA processing protein DprA n=1 Tax=Kaistella jeonii TaxID=266749 RepID=A0A0C1D632_9FLAO|nr:DNA-processing protein DprA [Kaistella jeonii]KIA89235.1 DNA processing protein DprA [Kaistella jeonii]SFC00732.1 DNA processing protein [Kaistella jeonii]VEI96543.1 DNA protecting protein DprA [Kaistella jeonii]